MESNNHIYMEYDVDQKVVQAKLAKLSLMYQKDRLLHSILRQMLAYDPLDRPDFVALAKLIPDRESLSKYQAKDSDDIHLECPVRFQPEAYQTKLGKYSAIGPQIFQGETPTFKKVVQDSSNLTCKHED